MPGSNGHSSYYDNFGEEPDYSTWPEKSRDGASRIGSSDSGHVTTPTPKPAAPAIDPDKPKPVTPPKRTPDPEPTPAPDPKPSTPAPDPKPAPTPGPEDGLNWFTVNWKTIAIIAGAAAIIAALAKLIKSLDRSIKVRFQKCANILQRMQKDFTLSENGLDMKTVLPGVGSKLMDKIARVWTGLFKRRKNRPVQGAIGLHPFCQAYKDEIAADFKLAQESYNKIAAVKEDSVTSPKVESNITVYNSFKDAYRADHINESESLNEVAIGTVFALSGLAIRGGQFIFSQIKDGKPVKGTEKAVQVTKESTREICYAIMNNFLTKYINMDAVMKKIGVTGDLSDVDQSSVDKLHKVLKAYGSVADKHMTQQYARIKQAYDQMLKHYFNIGNGIISNFKTNTKAEDEKHQNLLVAATEKLFAMWDKQKDIYNNNFSHVLMEIVKSDEYISYLNFIIEKVFPVFKSGIAGDADYILDVMPKKDEYYVVRQTLEQSQLKDGDKNNGNIVLVKVTAFNRDAKRISFERIGLIKSDIDYNDDGTATILSPDNIDKDAFRDDKIVENLEYGKWLAIDPHLTEYKSEEDKKDDVENDDKVKRTTTLYVRTTTTKRGREITEYIFGEIISSDENIETVHADGNSLNEDGETEEKEKLVKVSKAVCCNIKKDSDIKDDISANLFSGSYIDIEPDCTETEFDDACKNLGFKEVDEGEQLKTIIINKIQHNKGITFTTTVDGKFTIADIQKAIEIIENRETTAETLTAEREKIADAIINKVNGLNLQPTKDYFNYGKFNPSQNGWRMNADKNPAKREGGSITFDTGIYNATLKKNITLLVYPTLLSKADGKELAQNIEPSAENAVIGIRLSLGDSLLRSTNKDLDLHYTCAFDKTEIADRGIIAMRNMLVSGSQIEDVRGGKNEQPAVNNQPAANTGTKPVDTSVNVSAREKNWTLPTDVSANVTAVNSGIQVDADYKVSVSESANDYILVTRKLTGDIDKNSYILTESVWNDGHILDVNDYFGKHTKEISKFKTYEQLTSYVKKNGNVRLKKYSTTDTYKVSKPVNRYNMLSVGNSLCESIILVNVNGDKISIVNLGVHKTDK